MTTTTKLIINPIIRILFFELRERKREKGSEREREYFKLFPNIKIMKLSSYWNIKNKCDKITFKCNNEDYIYSSGTL